MITLAETASYSLTAECAVLAGLICLSGLQRDPWWDVQVGRLLRIERPSQQCTEEWESQSLLFSIQKKPFFHPTSHCNWPEREFIKGCDQSEGDVQWMYGHADNWGQFNSPSRLCELHCIVALANMLTWSGRWHSCSLAIQPRSRCCRRRSTFILLCIHLKL